MITLHVHLYFLFFQFIIIILLCNLNLPLHLKYVSEKHILFLSYWQTRIHCCGHIVAGTNVSPFVRARNICCGHKYVPDFVQKHVVSATNVSQFAQPKKHHEQQCVRNNVASFASTFRPRANVESKSRRIN